MASGCMPFRLASMASGVMPSPPCSPLLPSGGWRILFLLLCCCLWWMAAGGEAVGSGLNNKLGVALDQAGGCCLSPLFSCCCRGGRGREMVELGVLLGFGSWRKRGVGVVGCAGSPSSGCPGGGSDVGWEAAFGRFFQLTRRRGTGRCPRQCAIFVAKVPLLAADDTCGAPTRLVLYSTEQAAQRLALSVSLRLAGPAVEKITAADRPREVPGFFCVFPFTQGFF